MWLRERFKFLLDIEGFIVVKLVVELIILDEKYCIIDVSVIEGFGFMVEIILNILVNIGKSRFWFLIYILFNKVFIMVLFWM